MSLLTLYSQVTYINIYQLFHQLTLGVTAGERRHDATNTFHRQMTLTLTRLSDLTQSTAHRSCRYNTAVIGDCLWQVTCDTSLPYHCMFLTMNLLFSLTANECMHNNSSKLFNTVCAVQHQCSYLNLF